MPELDPIEQEIIVETQKAIAAMEAMVRAGAATTDQMHDLLRAVEEAQAAIDSMHGKEIDVRIGGGLSEFVSRLDETTGAAERVIAVGREGTATLLSMDEAARAVGGGFERQIFAINEVADAMQAVGRDGGGAAAGIAAAGAAAGGADRNFRIWGTGIRVGGNALHWLIAGSMEFLAVAVPAFIAAGDAAMVMAEGATWVADRMKGIFTSAEATSAMLGQTTGSVLGLRSSLQQAQTAADPRVYELLGASVNAVRNSFGNFWSSGLQVVDVLDRFAAHIDLVMAGGLGGQMQAAIGHMVADLTALGQVLGNVGHFFLSIATEMPGLAEVLLGVLAGFTHLLNILVAPAWFNFGGHLITIAMGLEETGRWGGLLMRGLGPAIAGLGNLAGKIVPIGSAAGLAANNVAHLGNSMGKAGAMSTSFAGTMKMLFTTPWGWVLMGTVALGALVISLANVRNQAQQFAEAMSHAVDTAAPTKAFALILQDLPQLQARLDAASAAYEHAVRGSMSFYVQLHAGSALTGQAASAVDAYRAALTKMMSQLVDLVTVDTTFQGHTYTLATTLALATAAGVDMNHMFDAQGHLTATARQQIINLIQGYQDMAQTGSVLANDINAVTVQTLMQQTRVQQLNSAWDSFLQTATGGTSALAGLNSQLETIGNVTQTATSQVRAFSQGNQGTALSVDQISRSLNSFSGTSAQVWMNYNSAVSQAQKVTDWLRTAAAAGAVGNQQYIGSIKGVVAELLPYVKYSQTAAAELGIFVQQAGGPAMSTYKQLAQWVGNTNDAQKTLNDTVQKATVYMSNLGEVAANLASTLDSQVSAALAQGTINVKGISDAAQNFNNQLHQGNFASIAFQGSLKNLVAQLVDAGTPAKDIASIIYQIGQRAGLSQSQLGILAQEALTLAGNLGKIHDVSYTVTQFSQMIQLPGSAQKAPPGIRAPGAAMGMRVPGFGGGDIVPAMLEPGEAVIPKHLVGAVAPFLSAHGVPGFASGGLVHRRASRPSPMELVIEQWAREIWRSDLHKYGRKGPIGITEMRHLFGATRPGKGGMWNNPQFRALMGDERSDMNSYYLKDVMYSDILGKRAALTRHDIAIQAAIESDITRAMRKHEYATAAGLRRALLRDIASDRAKFGMYSRELEALFKGMGYSRGGRVPFGHYDRGGYLPTGLSMALNTTGRPEPVGGGGGPGVMHVHLNVGGQEIANAIVPYMVGSVNRYGIRNSGKATGIMKPT